MMSANLKSYLAVGLGSGLGAVTRYLCSLGAIAVLGTALPWGTLLVNMLGSFVMGLYAILTSPDGRLFATPTQRLFVLPGFCGGFTTFSIFSLETLQLIEQSAIIRAGVYVLASIVVWMLFVWAGYRVGLMFNHRASR